MLSEITSSRQGSLAAQRAAIARAHRKRDSAAESIARQTYAAAKLADYITRTVDSSPPLTDEQRDRLAALLRPAGAA